MDPKDVRIPLVGMTTDGMEHEIVIAETENWVKPVGGAREGFESRPGIAPYDVLTTGSSTPGFGRVHLCELDPEEGFPSGTFMVIFQENVTNTILDMITTRASEGSFGFDEVVPPDIYEDD